MFPNSAELQELLPGILNQMGPDSLMHLKKMMAQASSSSGKQWVPHICAYLIALSKYHLAFLRKKTQIGGAGGFPGAGAAAGADDDDDGEA